MTIIPRRVAPRLPAMIVELWIVVASQWPLVGAICDRVVAAIQGAGVDWRRCGGGTEVLRRFRQIRWPLRHRFSHEGGPVRGLSGPSATTKSYRHRRGRLFRRCRKLGSPVKCFPIKGTEGRPRFLRRVAVTRIRHVYGLPTAR